MDEACTLGSRPLPPLVGGSELAAGAEEDGPCETLAQLKSLARELLHTLLVVDHAGLLGAGVAVG